MIVTCVYAVHDPLAGTLTYGNAGHVPPLLSCPGEPTVRLEVGDPPLGTGRYRGDVATVPWPAGARLMLYTDGLVEHRGSDIDQGIDRLAGALDASAAPVEALPGELVAATLPQAPDDDVAILVAELPAGAPRRITLALPAVETGVADVRRAVRDALAEWGIDAGTGADAVLVASELVTNAIQHGRPPITFLLRHRGDQLVLEASDSALERPRVRDVDPAAAHGRGLRLVDSLAVAWGSRPTGLGKSVWCVLPLPG
jgi:anti-sigma regulatory factor (Ser/Thr protein kinase)